MDKRILLPLVILPAFQTGNMQAADQPAKRPNIILFMVDDMGWEDTSLPFWTEKTHYNEVYETPNMELPSPARESCSPRPMPAVSVPRLVAA